MAFDPDAYLAQSAEPVAPSFDPDAYLAESAPAAPPKPSRKEGILSRLAKPERALAESSPNLFRAYTGIRGTVDKGAQLLEAALPDVVNRGIDAADRWAAEKTGGIIGQPLPSSEMRQSRKEMANELNTDGGMDWYQTAGSVADPAAWVLGAKAFQAAPTVMSGVSNVLARGAEKLGGRGASALNALSRGVNPASAALQTGVKSGIAAGTVAATSAPLSEESVKAGLVPAALETAGQAAKAAPVGFIFGAAAHKLFSKAAPMAKEEIAAEVAKNPEQFQAIQNNINLTMKNSGIDLDSLPPQIRNQVDDYVAQAVAYKANPEQAAEVAREAILKKVGTTGSKGQITQKSIEQMREEIARASGYGDSLVAQKTDQQTKLFDYMDKMESATGGKQLSEADFGRSLRDFVSGKYAGKRAQVSSMYKKAEEVLGDVPAKLSDNEVVWFAENAGFPGVNGLTTKAKALGILGTDDAGNLIAKDVNFKKLAQLRSSASQMTKGGGQEAHYGGEFKKQLDNFIEKNGGDMYKQAAKARREQGLTYESGSKAISQMLKKAGGSETAPMVADEDIFNKVIVNMSNDEVGKLMKFAAKDAKGEGAIRNVRSQAVAYLRDAAQGKNDRTSFSYGNLENAINKMGGIDKLKVIFGDEAAKEVNLVLQAGKIANKAAPKFNTGSDTTGKMALLGNSVLKMLDKVPVVGTASKVLAPKAQAVIKSANAMQSPVKSVMQKAPLRDNALSIAARNALILGGRDE